MKKDSNRGRPGATLLQELQANLWEFPWRNTALTLRERLREDRLAQTASSLTFSTVIALVPLFTLGLAILSAMPSYVQLEGWIEGWLISSLVPEHIANTVLQYLQLFAEKASSLGWGGGVVLLITAFSIVLTFDRTLNAIWRVRRRRSFLHRVLMYWAVLTLGPLILGGTLALTSDLLAVASSSRSVVRTLFDWVGGGLQFLTTVAVLALLYRMVPNAPVRLAHALTGSLLAALVLEVCKGLMGWYLGAVPSYSVIYGAFATVPILLVWIYLLWLVVLLGAVVTAYLPALLMGVARTGGHDGWDFTLAVEVLGALHAQSGQAQDHGMSAESLAQGLGVSTLQLERALQVLADLGWIARLDHGEDKWVLTCNLSEVSASDLIERLLVAKQSSTEALWYQARWAETVVTDLLAAPKALPPGGA